MILFKSIEEYKIFFDEKIEDSKTNSDEIQIYYKTLLERLDKLINKISTDSFWLIFPEILGIDAKLNLLVEMIKDNVFSNSEIIRIVENDYETYLKELCGFSLNMPTKHSLVFNIK